MIAEVKRKNPSRTFAEHSKLLGQMWREAPDAVRVWPCATRIISNKNPENSPEYSEFLYLYGKLQMRFGCGLVSRFLNIMLKGTVVFDHASQLAMQLARKTD